MQWPEDNLKAFSKESWGFGWSLQVDLVQGGHCWYNLACFGKEVTWILVVIQLLACGGHGSCQLFCSPLCSTNKDFTELFQRRQCSLWAQDWTFTSLVVFVKWNCSSELYCTVGHSHEAPEVTRPWSQDSWSWKWRKSGLAWNCDATLPYNLSAIWEVSQASTVPLSCGLPRGRQPLGTLAVFQGGTTGCK